MRIKTLLIILAATSGISLIFTGPVPAALQWLNPHMWLGLSHWGLKHYFVWQLLTYSMVPPLDAEASFSFLLNTFFTLYLLWTVGNAIIMQKGSRSFWIVFIGSAFVGGGATAISFWLTNSHGLLAGWTPALYGLLVAWMLLNPTARVLVFFAIPMRVTTVVIGAAAITLYLDLANGHYLQFVASFSSVLFGYIYAIRAWDIHSPFTFLNGFERFVRGRRKIYDLSRS